MTTIRCRSTAPPRDDPSPGAAGRAQSRVPLAVPAVLAGATVLAQIVYPLVEGELRNRLTVLTVLLFAAASVTAAWRSLGRRSALILLVVSAGVGLVAEAVGTATGVPFGDYTYADSLGVRLLDVPLIIPLAWTMMAYPALVVGRVVADGWRLGTPGRVVVSALALASWDVFLDPQMVDAGHWTFGPDNGPTLTGIPLVNFAGWLLVALLLMTVLAAVLPEPRDGDVTNDWVPLALYLWTYASSLLANLAFFDRPAVALTGGLAMGVPVALLLLALHRRRT